MALTGQQLLDYACAQFENGAYDAALEAFILAYTKEYEQEWVLENIYNCYMAGNEAEFQKNYGFWNTGEKPAYENLTLDFIPYREGEYYIFDKIEKKFWGLFSMPELEKTSADPLLQRAEFSAIALAMDWNWNQEKRLLKEARERMVYVVSHDVKRCVSFFKLPELSEYVKNLKIFADHQMFRDYFHQNTSVYLPKIIYGREEEKQELMKIVDEEHQYRLTPEGRNTENVLLTIGIPTHERGNLVLKRIENLLSMQYDAEVEIAISKNGTKQYQKEYEEVSKIPDARINYFDHGKELKYYINWVNVLEMAHGKYVLMVSDEDSVILEALEHYFKLLQMYPDVNLVRARTTFQHAGLSKRVYAKKGLEAFYVSFLSHNYLSGLIIRRDDFLEEHVLELQRFDGNLFYYYYPHEWWCALLNRKGDYIEDPVTLIDEHESDLEEETQKSCEQEWLTEEHGIWGDMLLHHYSISEIRLKQLQGQIAFGKWYMQDDKAGMEIVLEEAFGKTSLLLKIARECGYKKEKFEEFVAQYRRICTDAVSEAVLDDSQKRNLLDWVQKLANDLLQRHKELCEETGE